MTHKLLPAAEGCWESDRVGRTAAAKQLSTGVIGLAVIAYIRHNHTAYDELLAKGYPRDLAREQIRDKVDEVVASWAGRPEVWDQAKRLLTDPGPDALPSQLFQRHEACGKHRFVF